MSASIVEKRRMCWNDYLDKCDQQVKEFPALIVVFDEEWRQQFRFDINSTIDQGKSISVPKGYAHPDFPTGRDATLRVIAERLNDAIPAMKTGMMMRDFEVIRKGLRGESASGVSSLQEVLACAAAIQTFGKESITFPTDPSVPRPEFFIAVGSQRMPVECGSLREDEDTARRNTEVHHSGGGSWVRFGDDMPDHFERLCKAIAKKVHGAQAKGGVLLFSINTVWSVPWPEQRSTSFLNMLSSCSLQDLGGCFAIGAYYSERLIWRGVRETAMKAAGLTAEEIDQIIAFVESASVAIDQAVERDVLEI